MLTICMIVKNEEPVLEKTLQEIKKLGYEIVIVDTGSVDNTKSIAKKYTDDLYDYVWKDDFSDARNFAIEKASNDFVLMIDADEVIADADREKLEDYIVKNEKGIGRIAIVNKFNNNGVGFESIEKVGRLFSRKYYRYEGAIHEQLVRIDGAANNMYELPMKVIHNGYDDSELKRKDKVNRNISLLKKEIEDNLDDAYLLYQLGKTYYIAKEYENAVSYFNKAMDLDLDIRLEYVQDLVVCYGYSLINLKEYSTALNILNLSNEFSHNSDFIFLCGLIYMNNGLFEEAVNEFLNASKMNNAKIVGVNDKLSFYNIGVIYECLGMLKEAEKFYLKCIDYKPALDRLKGMDKSY